MKILVTGGTGFTGKRVLPLLQNKGDIYCFFRNPQHESRIRDYGYTPVFGNIKDREALLKAMNGMDGLINIVSLGFGDAPQIVETAEVSGIKKAVFVSTTAIETRLNVNSKKVRVAAEEKIKSSRLKWTILRPTMIYGGEDDRNMIKLIRFVRKCPVIPVPGNGASLQQPVFVNDLAMALVNAFFSENVMGKVYNISGKEPLSFNEIILETAKALKLKRFLFHIPIKPVTSFFQTLESFSKKPFLKSEQILRLLEDKAFSHELAQKDFNYCPLDFVTGIRKEIESLKIK